jgi:hypothetical protein
MNTDELIAQACALRDRIQPYGDDNPNVSRATGAKAQVCEFLRTYAGPKSSFVEQASQAGGYASYQVGQLTAVLDSFIEYLKSGLHAGLSPQRRAQIDVVSDILGQADQVLANDKYHPADAAVLIGASLEEFLRNWVEAEGLLIGEVKPGIDAYCKALRGAELVSKQDAKDITAWAGIRNHAAHGEWEQVADRNRIRLMLEGVNLFMRQKTA